MNSEWKGRDFKLDNIYMLLQNGIPVWVEAALRLLLASVIGGLIGWERGRTNRPAGLRTHMLVAIGAAVVMMLGAYTVKGFAGIANSDPARLGAQVISGIGFLGAGTIMKEAGSVKGLTTAASLWVVACLGLAAGSGNYIIAIMGSVVSFVILHLFGSAMRHPSHEKMTHYEIKCICEDVSLAYDEICRLADDNCAEIKMFRTWTDTECNNWLDVQINTERSKNYVGTQTFMREVKQLCNVSQIEMEIY